MDDIPGLDEVPKGIDVDQIVQRLRQAEDERDAYRKALEEIAAGRGLQIPGDVADQMQALACNALESRVSRGHGPGRTD